VDLLKTSRESRYKCDTRNSLHHRRGETVARIGCRARGGPYHTAPEKGKRIVGATDAVKGILLNRRWADIRSCSSHRLKAAPNEPVRTKDLGDNRGELKHCFQSEETCDRPGQAMYIYSGSTCWRGPAKISRVGMLRLSWEKTPLRLYCRKKSQFGAGPPLSGRLMVSLESGLKETYEASGWSGNEDPP